MNTVVPATGSPNAVAQELFREALAIHNQRPKLDPTKDRGLLDEFTQCASTNDVMQALEKRVNGLKDFRDDRWAKLREKLEPVVEVVLRITTVVSESAQSNGIPGDNSVFAAVSLLLAATQAQSARYDALEKILERLGRFLSRFNILYEKTSPQKRRSALDQIATTILAHLFYVLALSTKFLRKSRFWHHLHTVSGLPRNLKDALQKLDDLTKDEGMMIGAYYLHQLPPEIASQIFLFYKDINCRPSRKTAYPFPYSDPLGLLLRLSSVCRKWREIMFATPELWVTINIYAYAISIPLHAELAKQWLDRAGALPLSITVYCKKSSLSDETVNPDELDPLFEVLRKHNAQWRELVLYLPMDFYPCFQGDLTGAPVLESFRLLPTDNYTTHRHQLLLPNTPRLVHLEISFPRLVDILGQWDGLTHFEAEAVSVEEIFFLLKLAPRLVVCKAGGVNDLLAFGIPSRPITHSCLKELHFAPYHDLVALNTLFEKTRLPALEHFVYAAPVPLDFPMNALCSLFNRSQSPLTQFTFVEHPGAPRQFDDTKVIELLEKVPAITQLQIHERQSSSYVALLSNHLIRWIVEWDFEVLIPNTEDPRTKITVIRKRSDTTQQGAGGDASYALF